MTSGFELHNNLDRIDWAKLKEDLSADDFDNGRSAEELRASFANSFATIFATHDDRTIGTARLLADGVCNAYLVDVWTLSDHRRRGIGSAMVRDLLDRVPGHHVALFTEAYPEFYEALGFSEEHVGMSTVVGEWLGRTKLL